MCCAGDIHKEHAFYILLLTHFAVKHYCWLFGKAGMGIIQGHEPQALQGQGGDVGCLIASKHFNSLHLS